MDAIRVPGRVIAVLEGGVGDDDGGTGRGLLLRPTVDSCIEGVDVGLAEGERDQFINLELTARVTSSVLQNSLVVNRGRKWEMTRGGTYNDLNIGLLASQCRHDRRVRLKDGLNVTSTPGDIIGTEHELHNVRLVRLRPARDVLLRDVDRLPARVALMVWVEARGAGALLLQVVHAADEVDVVRQSRTCDLVPDEGPPAADFGDRVSEEHCAAELNSICLDFLTRKGLVATY